MSPEIQNLQCTGNRCTGINSGHCIYAPRNINAPVVFNKSRARYATNILQSATQS